MKKEVQCNGCGNIFIVNIDDKTRKIKTRGIFYTKYSNKHFTGWTYIIPDKIKNEGFDFNHLKPLFKNNFWKIIGYTRIQRTIIYFFISKYYGMNKKDYWECKTCNSPSYKIIKWKKK